MEIVQPSSHGHDSGHPLGSPNVAEGNWSLAKTLRNINFLTTGRSFAKHHISVNTQCQ